LLRNRTACRVTDYILVNNVLYTLALESTQPSLCSTLDYFYTNNERVRKFKSTLDPYSQIKQFHLLGSQNLTYQNCFQRMYLRNRPVISVPSRAVWLQSTEADLQAYAAICSCLCCLRPSSDHLKYRLISSPSSLFISQETFGLLILYYLEKRSFSSCGFFFACGYFVIILCLWIYLFCDFSILWIFTKSFL
jgi:hypothetical protein